MSDDADFVNGEDHGYGLVLPFNIVTSAGGPYDDDAFVAGWGCAVIDSQLEAIVRISAPFTFTVPFTVQPEWVPQLDLIAMRHDARIGSRVDIDGWAQITITNDNEDASDA